MNPAIKTETKCTKGLSMLQTIGLNPTVEDLDIAFCDPFGLSSDLCKIQNRYAFQGECQKIYPAGGGGFAGLLRNALGAQNNPVFPTLYIDGKDMGTLENLKVQAIKALAEPSPFGLGTKTVYDENVRKASEIKGNRINLDMRISEYVQGMAPMGYKIVPKLYKLAIYEKDGFFAEHADTQHGENHIGTLVVCLPVPHEGGTFILSDDGNELRLPFDQMIKNDKVPWVAFYTDVKHQVEVVKSGVRMTIQYDLITEKKVSEDDNDLSSRLEGGYYREPNMKYRFQEFNEENIKAIKDKLDGVFSKQKNSQAKPIEKNKFEENKSDDLCKQAHADDLFKQAHAEFVKLNIESKKKEEKEDEEVENENDDSEKRERILLKKFSNPEGIAIMLKRRYGAASLSIDKLKGTDNALYHALKDDFKVEVKQIILEQSSNDEGYFTNQPIEVVAIAELVEKQEACSSEEESEAGPNSKHVPALSNRKSRRYRDDEEIYVKENELRRKVCLVSGLSPQALSQLVNQSYIECTGNEATEAVNSYIHAALFVYPKINS